MVDVEQQFSNVYHNGDSYLTDNNGVFSWACSKKRQGSITSKKATIVITKEIFTTSSIKLSDTFIIKRGPVTGDEYIIFRGKLSSIKEDESGGRITLDIRDPLYFYQFDVFIKTFNKNIDAEAGIISAIAETVIEGGGLTAHVVSSASYPTRERYIISQQNRLTVLEELADMLGWQVYFDHENNWVAFEPKGYYEYGTTLVASPTGNVINKPIWIEELDSMRNYITINGNFEQEKKTETFAVSDDTYTLAYEPGETKLDIDSVIKIRGIPDSTETYDYYVVQEEKQIVFPVAPSGTTITIEYTANIPIVVEGGLIDSMEAYGRQDDVFDFKDLVTMEDAENRHSYLLNLIGWPPRNTKAQIININDIDIKHQVRLIDQEAGKDLWLNVNSVTYTWPEPYDRIEVGESQIDMTDILDSIYKRLRNVERLNSQNRDIATQLIPGEVYLELDNSAVVESGTSTKYYYDEGTLYDSGATYDTGTESFNDIEIVHNRQVFYDDFKTTLWYNVVGGGAGWPTPWGTWGTFGTGATVDNDAGTINFTSGEFVNSETLFLGDSPATCRLTIPSNAITNESNLAYYVSGDGGTTWEATTNSTIHTLTSSDGTGVKYKIIASGDALIDFRQDAFNVPKLLTFEVNPQ